MELKLIFEYENKQRLVECSLSYSILRFGINVSVACISVGAALQLGRTYRCAKSHAHLSLTIKFNCNQLF